ncbi:MAG: hypothetical protein JSR17_06990 [Proteobacteria bacterium]|nr:hypothetical protein [Pseudomonadota bacterium]
MNGTTKNSNPEIDSENEAKDIVLYALNNTNEKSADIAPADENEADQEKKPQENSQEDLQKSNDILHTESGQDVIPPNENQQSVKADENALQNEADFFHLNIEQLIKLYTQDGNLSDLLYTQYGSPYQLQSVPRDLGIPAITVMEEKVYLPTITEKVQPSITIGEIPSPQEICCSNPVTIIFNPIIPESGLPTESMSDLAAQYSTLLNAAFQFTFQSCSDNDIAPQLIFTTSFEGVNNLEILESGSQFVHAPFNFREPSEANFSTDPITISINNDSDCVPPISCDNPITQIDILPFYGTSYETIDGNINALNGKQFDASIVDKNLADMSFQFDFDQLFSSVDGFVTHEVWSVYFLDSLGNIYQLLPPQFDSTPTLAYFPCAFSPIVLDLNNSGFELTNSFTSTVTIDVNGKTVQTGWIGKENAFLTYDYSGEGAIQNSNFILTQNVPGAKTDFQALVVLAGLNNGILDASNPIWNKLGVWQDANQNGQMDKGEYHTLLQLGIVSISLQESGSMMVQNGNIINGMLTFKYANGSVGQAADVSLNYHDVIQPQNTIPQLTTNQPNTDSSASQNATASSVPSVPLQVDLSVQHALEPTQQTTTHT